MLYVAGHTYAEFYRGGQQSSNEMQLIKQWRPELIAIGDQEGKLAGLLLARTGGANTMDALVVAAAARHAITEIFTSDPDDLKRLCRELETGPIPIVPV